MTEKQSSRETVLILSAVFLGSFSVLLFEMCQIRAFAFSMPPILAYSGISLAMTGFGIGAMVLSLMPDLFRTKPWSRLAVLMLLQGISMLLGSVIFGVSSWDVVLSLKEGGFAAAIFGVLLPGTLPYFFGGMFLAAMFGLMKDAFGKLYCYNLAGSAFGAVAIVLLIAPLGVERLISVSVAMACLSAVMMSVLASHNLKVVSVAAFIIALSLSFFAEDIFDFSPDPTDSIGRPLARAESGEGPAVHHEYADWNIVAKIDVWKTEGETARVPESVEYKVLTVDAGAVTLLMGDPGTPGWGADLFDKTLYGMAYQLRPGPENVLIIGSGGGSDVQSALYHGAKKITAVEVNTSTIDAVKGPFADFLKWPQSKNVEIVHADGRSFVKAPGKKFDVLQMSGVDTLTVYATGAFNMVEENLYTVEAFTDYLNTLSPRGVLSVVRFGQEHLRLAAIASEALRRRGIVDPRGHIICLQQHNLNGILVSNEPFAEGDIDTILQFGSRSAPSGLSLPPYEMYNLKLYEPIRPVYVPGKFVKPSFKKFFEKIENFKDKPQRAITVFSIPTDDNPFYLFTGLLAGGDHLLAPVRDALQLLKNFWYAIVLFALGLIVIPVVIFRRRLQSKAPLVWIFPNFFVLGACFMMLEVGIISRFAIFVGSPGASTATVLTSILLFSGIGAYFSDSRARRPERTIAIAAVLLMVFSTMLHFASPALMDACFEAELGFGARGLLAGLMVAPIGFFLGWFFPAGLRAINIYIEDDHLLPWAISVNGFASVVGSVVALPVTIFWGFQTLFGIALGGYLFVGVFSFLYFRNAVVSGKEHKTRIR